jgi:endonuclease-3
MSRAGVKRIINLLIDEYGDRDWHPDDDPVSVLVGTILSQNTSDVNSHRAFSSLLSAFPTWDDVAAAREGDIAEAIKTGGLGDIKSGRIKQALNEIKKQQGRIELDFLRQIPLAEARDWLMELPGVGMKTANCVFLFSLGMPALPVDTHIFRVAKRLGLEARRRSRLQGYRHSKRGSIC